MNRLTRASTVRPIFTNLSENMEVHANANFHSFHTMQDVCDTTTRMPCLDEFKELMNCLTYSVHQHKIPVDCHQKFLELKSCLKVHGLKL